MSLGISSYVWGALALLAGYRGHVYLAVAMVAIYGLVWMLDRMLLDATTASLDLGYINRERKEGKFRGTAVVAGGSIAGILSAKVLSTHFQRVVIVDDEVQEKSLVRRTHVGQHSRLHALSPFATDVVELMFPKLDVPAEIRALGGRTTYVRDLERFYIEGGRVTYAKDFAAKMLVLSRPSLETWIRKQVLSLPNVELVSGRVTGLKLDEQRKNRVAGVDISLLNGSKTSLQVLLVADCTGPSSVGQKWLKRLGYETPRTTSYNPGIPYIDVKCLINQEEWDQLQPPPQVPKDEMGAISMSVGSPFREKKGIAIVHRSDPALAEPGDVAFMHVVYALREEYGSLPETPAELLDALRQNTDIGDYSLDLVEKLVGFPRWTKIDRMTVERCARVHYDELASLPANFAAVGDSCVRLNPTLCESHFPCKCKRWTEHTTSGQGITQAMRMAVTLNTAVYKARGEELPDDFSRRYFGKVMKRCDALIDGNKLQDAKWSSFEPGEGETTPETNTFLTRFMGKLLHATHHDTVCGAFFSDMINGMVSPLQLFSPEMLARIWWASFIPDSQPSKRLSSAA